LNKVCLTYKYHFSFTVAYSTNTKGEKESDEETEGEHWRRDNSRSRPGCPIQAVLSWLSCADCPALTVLSYQHQYCLLCSG
jgi:hypothetical protein